MELNAKYSYAKNGEVLTDVEYISIMATQESPLEEVMEQVREEVYKKTGRVGVKFIEEV